MTQRYPSAELIQCPYPFFETARGETPIWLDPESGVYFVFRYEDVLTVLRENETFAGINGTLSQGDVPMISAAEGDEHRSMRNLAQVPFTKARLRSYEPMIAQYADDLIDRFIDAGHVELVDDFAIPLPALVICDLMGFPTEGAEFDGIVDRMSIKGSDNPDEVAKAEPGLPTQRNDYGATGASVVLAHMDEAVRRRVANPGDDILSEIALRQIARDGEVNVDYLVTIGAELLKGGVVTTAQMIANAMMLAMQNPDQMEAVRADPELIVAMLDEGLRVESPVQSKGRMATRDFVLSGVPIPKGSTLALVYGSANRDPERFPSPNSFDVHRPKADLKAHFGFGFGQHFCMGAPLALLEGRIGLERLFARVTNIRPAADYSIRYIANTHFRAVRTQHLDFDVVQVEQPALPPRQR